MEVKLVIGDRVFLTTQETLKTDAPNRFEKQLEFKDRDPVYGGYVVQYLRGSHSFLQALTRVERAMLLDEARFYGLTRLATLLEAGNEVKNAQKFSNALISIRFNMLQDPRHEQWISDDTWWTGMVSTLLSFDFFRSIMQSEAQTESFITLLNDVVLRYMSTLEPSTSSDEDDDEDEDDDYDGLDTPEDEPQEKVMAVLPVRPVKKHDSGSTEKHAEGGARKRTSSRRRATPPPPVAPAPV